ncbi:GTPase-binding protein rid1 [Grifola frondosa]|uniref:GTPase-binding protein rid1 n=1 Tax=Grifola frondosa TaxID=5627 RepID=A0A1C7M744_GRIFR|nr:GTPase-binding protein rid1 [Grifola frondosa]
MLTGPLDSAENGKENYPQYLVPVETKPRAEKRKKSKVKDGIATGPVTGEDFEKLLDELQIPPTLRPKLATMDPTVKAAMLKSSQALTLGVRKARSSDSLTSPSPRPSMEESARARSPFRTTGHGRGLSLDVKRRLADGPSDAGKPTKDKRMKLSALAPEKYCSILLGSSSTHLEVESVKKLRLLLRNEAASWTEAFLQQGGYTAILTRLNEILTVEWREEQHDDQILHELLRCIKALSTSSVGCTALRSSCPSPFAQLITLLYSDKRPGDISTRQLVVELLLILFELYPPSSLPSIGSPTAATFSHSYSSPAPWENNMRASTSSNLVTLPAPHATLFALLKSLLLTPAPPPSECPSTPVEPHSFIEELHRPRIYKTYLQELSDVCRDYFWVFCHPTNAIWDLRETDERKVEKPRAPGGMTGGVEFEAMGYMTTHFRFLNALARAAHDLRLPREHADSAHQLHRDMLLSGIDRIILLARKASTTYYPTLHLEIARYVAAASQAGVELPWALARLVGPPPSGMRRSGSTRPDAQSTLGMGSSAPAPRSPTKRTAAAGSTSPGLPALRKVTPMFGQSLMK